MLDEKKRPLHAHPSLSPCLRMALIAAERESPAYPRRVDLNERLAMQLIARMQARYKKAYPFVTRQDAPCEGVQEMAGGHGR
ncbi:MAG: hypothetical protein M0C28_44475 [Candidatus Moduliflexus flocculans]|nr:hypothetical protein [Candidatus Moduliflexus flocculans]